MIHNIMRMEDRRRITEAVKMTSFEKDRDKLCRFGRKRRNEAIRIIRGEICAS